MMECDKVCANCLHAALPDDEYPCDLCYMGRGDEDHWTPQLRGGESDPNGIQQHEPGAKLDAGKNRLALVLRGFADALWAVGEVGTYGLVKYIEEGWKDVPDAVKRYEDAEMRHTFKRWMGEQNDPQSNLAHLAHKAWNSLAVLQKAIEEEKKNAAE